MKSSKTRQNIKIVNNSSSKKQTNINFTSKVGDYEPAHHFARSKSSWTQFSCDAIGKWRIEPRPLTGPGRKRPCFHRIGKRPKRATRWRVPWTHWWWSFSCLAAPWTGPDWWLATPLAGKLASHPGKNCKIENLVLSWMRFRNRDFFGNFEMTKLAKMRFRNCQFREKSDLWSQTSIKLEKCAKLWKS